MKKLLNYYGFAFDKCSEGYNKKYLLTKEGKKTLKQCKKNKKKLQKELKENGFDSSETWNLDVTIVQFTLPRLKYFSENLVGYPSELTEKKWKKILDNIIWSFENYLKEETEIPDKKSLKKYQKGFDLFGKYLTGMWS